MIENTNFQRNKTNTEILLEQYPTIEVKMNKQGQFANEGEILYTEGLNGCTALIVRIEEPNGNVRGFLAHKHTDEKRIEEFIAELERDNIDGNAKLYGTILYPGNQYGQILDEKIEEIQQRLQQALRCKLGNRWQQLRSIRYAINKSGIPLSVNSDRLVYKVGGKRGLWIYREGATQEHPLSGFVKQDNE